MGGYGIGNERLVSCTIVDYIPTSKPLVGNQHSIIKVEEMFEAEYHVRIREEEEMEQTLPMGKLQRFS